VAIFNFYGYGNDLQVLVFWKASVRLSLTIRLTARIDTHSYLTKKTYFKKKSAYSVNEELGSNRLGLFRFLETETAARGECLRGSTTRGEAGLTVLGDCLRVICFDISFFCSYSSRSSI
jgi:hypothetical protein